MRFNIGEKVSFLKEVGEGTVVSYKTNSIVIVEDESGFEQEFNEQDLVKIHGGESELIVDNLEEEMYEAPRNSGQTAVRGLTKLPNYWEIDLHSHMILDTEIGLSSNQILTRQLYTFKRCFREAHQKQIRKLIVIHGVGEGVLKNEIRHFLEGREKIEFYDADFREYGKGATEIRLFTK